MHCHVVTTNSKCWHFALWHYGLLISQLNHLFSESPVWLFCQLLVKQFLLFTSDKNIYSLLTERSDRLSHTKVAFYIIQNLGSITVVTPNILFRHPHLNSPILFQSPLTHSIPIKSVQFSLLREIHEYTIESLSPNLSGSMNCSMIVL